MNIIEGIIMGLVQGLAEFLPISSSGHLVIASELLKLNTAENDLLFSMLLHLGTLTAVFVAFRSTVWELIKDFFVTVKQLFTGKFKKENATDGQKMLGCLIISILPLFIVYPFIDAIESVFSSMFPVGIMLLITSIFLFFSDRIPTGHKTAKNMGIKEALTVGLVQCVAVIPGISRSGSTITAGVASGLSRKYAAKYSFILSIPTILGGALVSFLKFFSAGNEVDSTLVLPYIAGFITAAITGFFAIKLLELLLKSRKFIIFSVYCFIVGAIAVIAGLII